MSPGSQPRRSARIKAKEESSATHGTPALLGIPPEILVMIFNLMCEGLAESEAKTKHAHGTSDASDASDAARTIRHEATDFLLACRHVYAQLAPLYWARRTLVFTDAADLANGFLGRASDTAVGSVRALHHVMRVHRVVATQQSVPPPHADPERSVRLLTRQAGKFCEVLDLYGADLASLASVTLHIDMDAWFSDLLFRRATAAAAEVDDNALDVAAADLWAVVDLVAHGSFGRVEKVVRRALLSSPSPGRRRRLVITAAMETAQHAVRVNSALAAVDLQTPLVCQRLTLTLERSD